MPVVGVVVQGWFTCMVPARTCYLHIYRHIYDGVADRRGIQATHIV